MRYDSMKHPLPHRLGIWSARKTNDSQEAQAKSIPCHVVKVEKDFVYVQFETNNSIFTMPTVKMTQGFSRFGREPTQKGDKGYAVPGGYYMGGVTAYAGGNTSFYPRGNLSTLSFQPVANLKAPKRDYDQHHETGGPNGWIVKTMEDQQDKQQQDGTQTSSSGNGTGTLAGNGGGSIPGITQTNRKIIAQRNILAVPQLLDGLITGGPTGTSSDASSGTDSSGSSSKQDDKTQFSFDKDGLATIQSKDTKHVITVDGKNKKVTIQVPTNETIYVGGDGSEGSYAPLMTKKGPVLNAQGRIA